MTHDVEVETTDGGRVVIEGKTGVPFKTFVGLILQRKVQTLKPAQDELVIVSGDLLTKLASAPEDSHEDRSKLVLVTLGIGILSGVFLSAVALLAMSLVNIHPRNSDLMILVGAFVGIAILVSILQRIQGASTKQKVYEKMEKVTDLLSRRR